MKTSNVQTTHSMAIIRGWLDKGLVFRDGTTNALSISDLTVVGGTLTDNGDGTATLTIGGTGGTGGGTGGSPTVTMLNNSGQDLLPGDVVVADGDENTAVTTTTTAGDTRIAGVVQEPIAAGETGPVLFNGYAPLVNAPGAVRGEYAQTSTTAKVADSTTDREAGSFAVYLTGDDFPDFITSSIVTQQSTPVETLTITMPTSIPADRELFLALWLVDGVTSVDVPDWTLIGAEAGFYYYTRLSTGADSAVATWSGVSVAVAIACLLDPAVSPAIPLADHDYENTTSAAAVSGLAATPHFALAGVRNEVLSPGSGFTYLNSGTAGFVASGSPALVQSKIGSTFDSTLTGDDMMMSIIFTTNHNDTWSTDPRQGGLCPPDSNMTKFAGIGTDLFGSSGENAVGVMGKIVDSGDTYSGPFGTQSGCDSSQSALLLLEFENIGIADYEVLTANDSNSSPVDCGTFTVGANDLVVMAVVGKSDGYGGFPDPVIGLNGFTQLFDTYGITNGWCWAGYKVGNGDASVTFSDGSWAGGGWAAIAVKLTGGTQSVEGTLAGKYIGTAASVTSPFSGAGNELDAIFAVNLLQEAKASALLYGPDLLGVADASGPTATYAWQSLFNSGDGTAIIDSGTGNPITAFAPV